MKNKKTDKYSCIHSYNNISYYSISISKHCFAKSYTIRYDKFIYYTRQLASAIVIKFVENV